MSMISERSRPRVVATTTMPKSKLAVTPFELASPVEPSTATYSGNDLEILLWVRVPERVMTRARTKSL